MANLAPGGSRGAAHGEERARAYRHGAEYISKLELGGAKLEAGEISRLADSNVMTWAWGIGWWRSLSAGVQEVTPTSMADRGERGRRKAVSARVTCARLEESGRCK
jgi:hypothetical protein